LNSIKVQIKQNSWNILFSYLFVPIYTNTLYSVPLTEGTHSEKNIKNNQEAHLYKKSKKHSLSVAIITDNDIFNGSLEFTGDVTQIK